MRDQTSVRTGSGRAALVTGSARRLGRMIALGLAEDGYDLALHHNRSGDEAAALRDEIEAMGRRAITVAGDLEAPEKATSIVEAARDALGPACPSGQQCQPVRAGQPGEPNPIELSPSDRRQPCLAGVPDAGLRCAARTASGRVDHQHAGPADGGPLASVLQLRDRQDRPGGCDPPRRLRARPDIRVNGIAPGLVLPSWLQTEEKHRSRLSEKDAARRGAVNGRHRPRRPLSRTCLPRYRPGAHGRFRPEPDRPWQQQSLTKARSLSQRGRRPTGQLSSLGRRSGRPRPMTPSARAFK